MKELSIEEKAKRYDEALTKARNIVNSINVGLIGKDSFEAVFPELKESEDERIRKELIKLLRNLFNNYSYFIKDPFYTECIAWLEKQGEKLPVGFYYVNSEGKKFYSDTFKYGDITLHVEKKGEQKPAIIIPKFRIGDEIKTSNEESLTITRIDEKGYWSNDLFICSFDEECVWDLVEQKPVDKDEPKFKVGDWVMLDRPVLITKVEDMPYNTHQYWTSDGTWFGDATKANLWTIKDAKDGDILAVENRPFIYNGKVNPLSVGGYCGITTNGLLKIYEERPGYGHKGWTMFDGDIYPATKEQRDLLLQKMHEAGYEWDAEKKELKKSEQKPLQWNILDYKTWQYIVSDVLTKHNGIGQYLDDGFCKKIAKYMQEEWSKKLSTEQKHAWNEEDDYNLQCMIAKVTSDIQKGNVGRNQELIDWLKSLRPQSLWKPSAEQIHAFEQVYDWYNNNFAPSETLTSLYSDLKKLRKE